MFYLRRFPARPFPFCLDDDVRAAWLGQPRRVPGASLEPLEDAMRVCRSRVRMYGKDAEFYMTPDAERVVWRWPQLWGEIFGGGGGGE